MARLLAIVLGVLVVATEAHAQEPDQWPPSEMAQPMIPVSVNPLPEPDAPASSVGNAADTWSWYGLAYAFGGLLAGFVSGAGAALSACHLKRYADGTYELSRGPMDWDALLARLDRIDARLEGIPPARLSLASQPPPATTRPRGSGSRARQTLAPPPAGPEDPP